MSRMNPFIGLRPFESEDSLYFFGRGEQVHGLIDRLNAGRFVAVVGSSGSGKSSLVRAGLIPALESGFLVQDRYQWEIAVLKPGDQPLQNLAREVASKFSKPEKQLCGNEIESLMKRRGALGLIDEIKPALDKDRCNFLIVVDQFEEIFRFQKGARTTPSDDASNFVSILLDVATHKTFPAYVVLTMRSEYIGECDRFWSLPERLNQSQYLVPRLSRHQRQEAIMGPIRIGGATIEPALVDRLLNESFEVRDDLPLLQHVLMRTYSEWAKDGSAQINSKHYETAGAIKEALDLHAEEAVKGLTAERLEIAKRMFQSLTKAEARKEPIRNPIHLTDMVKVITGDEPDQNDKVRNAIHILIAQFNADDRNFLVLSSQDTNGDPLIDISHESLIRRWKRFDSWVREETRAAETYLLLERAAVRRKNDNKTSLWAGRDLAEGAEWRKSTLSNPYWAARYGGDFKLATAFLEDSKKEDAKQKRYKRIKQGLPITILVIVVLIAVLLINERKQNVKMGIQEGFSKLSTIHQNEGAMKSALADAEGSFRRAVEWGKWVLLDDNTLANAHDGLGQIYLRKNKLADAEKEFATAIEISGKSGQIERLGTYHYHFAEALMPQGKYEEAEFNYKAALENKKSITGSDKMDILFKLGTIGSDHHKDFELARSYYKQATQCLKLPDTFVNAVISYSKITNEVVSISPHERILISYKSVVENVLKSAGSDLMSGKVADAEKKYKDLLATNPNDQDALIGIGNVLLARKEFTEAEEHFSTVISMDQGSKEILVSAYLGRGHVHASKINFEAAITDYKKALEIDKNNEWTLLYLADASRNAKLIKDSRNYLKQAEKVYLDKVSKDPKSKDDNFLNRLDQSKLDLEKP